MEKNTVWAIALSTVVLVAFFAVQTIFYPQPKGGVSKTAVNSANNTESVKQESPAEASGIMAIKDTSDDGAVLESSPELKEETFTVTTNKIKVTFTNRGGDVIGYELIDHIDLDTGKGIEMAKNISDKNRAFSIALGGVDSPILNDIFKVHEEKNLIAFACDYSVKNADGTDSKFTLVKTYTFKDDEYLFKLDVTVDGDAGFKGININDMAYSLRTSPEIGPSFNPKDRYDSREFIAYNKADNKKFTPNPKKDKRWDWIGVAGKYFITFINPVYESNGDDGENVTTSGFVRTITPDRNGGQTNAQVIFARKAISSNTTDSYYIYAGPRNETELKKYNSAENNAWKIKDSRYTEGLPTMQLLSWLEVVLKFFLEKLNWVISLISGSSAGNWGIAIIILTIILKLALFPLTKKSLSGTKKLQELQPRIQAIQAKYKDNPQKMQQETAKLYKEIGYNPMAGCLPMLIQLVILWAMYHLFNNYFEFRGAMFIPGWIPDLSTSDKVCTLGFSIPFLGNEVHILPVIYLVSQLLYGKITQNGGTATGQTGMQMKLMMYGMPIFFFFIFYSAPSGLLLYWTVSNIMQLILQLFINRAMKEADVQKENSKIIKRGK